MSELCEICGSTSPWRCGHYDAKGDLIEHAIDCAMDEDCSCSKSDPKAVCSKCGGTNIQTTAWVDPNDDEVFDYYNDDSWCEDCGENETVISFADYQKRKEQHADNRTD